MQYLLIAFSAVAGSAKSLLSKGLHSVNVNRYGLSRSNIFIFSAALSSILILSLILGFGGISGFTVLAGLIFACLLTAGQIIYMEALAAGPVSVTAFIYSCGFLIPTIAGVLFWQEAVTWTKVTGTLLLLAAFYLIGRSPRSGAEKSANSVKWQLCAFSAMVMSGLFGIMQKIHQTSAHKAEIGSFLAIAMAGAALLSAAIAFFSRKDANPVPFTGKIRATALACGCIYGLANFVNLRLAGIVPATLQFPLVNGGTIVLTAIMGRLLFKEHLTWPKRIGILLGILAIYIISR